MACPEIYIAASIRGGGHGIREALERPGSFYQSGGERSVYVFPDSGLVVAVASDR